MSRNLTPNTIANMTDASMVAIAASGIKATEAAGLRAILTAAVFLKVKGDSKVTQNLLFNAFAGVTSESSATNYTSKSRAAAMADHFKWTVDVNQPLDAVVDIILPEFRAFWQSVNNVKRSGPAPKTGGNSKKQPEQPEAPLTIKEATPLQLLNALQPRLSEMNADGIRILDAATLIALRDAINAEIAARADEAQAMVKRAA